MLNAKALHYQMFARQKEVKVKKLGDSSQRQNDALVIKLVDRLPEVEVKTLGKEKGNK